MSRTLVLLFVALRMPALCAGQAKPSDWTGLSAYATPAEVRVTLTDGKTLRGAVKSVSDESLIIATGTGEQSLARADVKRVQLRRAARRLRNALIGVAAGAGLGLASGAVADAASGCRDCIGPLENAGKIVLMPLGMIVGAVVGVVWPGRWVEVYRAPSADLRKPGSSD